MSKFPPEILSDILSRLPPKDLVRSLCVSKAWYGLIHDRRFIKAHLQRSIGSKSALTFLLKNMKSDFYVLPFNDNENFGTAVKTEEPLNCPDEYAHISGSAVHGLVCIHISDRRNVALWNPSIRKFKKISSPVVEPQPDSDPSRTSEGEVQYGFGYDSVNDDYKVMGIVRLLEVVEFNSNGLPCNMKMSSQVHIYSLKSNSWKRIENNPRNGFPWGPFLSDDIVFFNGALSWLIYEHFDRKRSKIITLDLASEKYQEFSTPVDKEEYSPANLVVLEECLCFYVNHYQSRHDVWIMKEYGVIESWTLLYSIVREAGPWNMNENFTPLVFSKNGKMVVLRSDYNEIFWFHLEKKIVERVQIHGLPNYFCSMLCVDGSLCLLDGDPVIVGRQEQVPSTTNI